METVIALIVIGAVLLLIETVLPGMIAGTLGVICLGGAIFMGYSTFGATTGTWILFGVGIFLVVLFGVYVKVFPGTPVARTFISQGQIGGIGAERTELLGRTGVAHTPLRPSGTAIIDEQRVDVVSEGSMIERGTPVKVVAVEGARVVVRAT